MLEREFVVAVALLAGCGTNTTPTDAAADCTPYASIPDATEYFEDGGDLDAGCVGDPVCKLSPCDGGSGVHPSGTEAVLPRPSYSDFNCQQGNYCACQPQFCVCGYDTAMQWYCPQ